MSCPDCRTFSVSKNLNIARGFFGVLASILFLSTIIVFGANMDYANYPGSNMVLKVVDGGDNDGEFVKLAGGDGFAIDKTHCTKNFIHTGTSAEGVAAGYCGAVEDDVPQALVVKDEDGKEASNKKAHGWTIMPVSQSSKPPRLMSSTFPLLPSSAGVPAPRTAGGMSDAAHRERSSASGRAVWATQPSEKGRQQAVGLTDDHQLPARLTR